jgi:hypothetical protein
MKRRLMIVVLMMAGCLTAASGETPVWEIRTRLAGGGHEGIRALMVEALGGEEVLEMLGEQVEVRMAGFEDAETPGMDWVGEVRGVAGMEELMSKLEETLKPDGKGRYRMEEAGQEVVVWRDSGDVLRMASPPDHAGVTVETEVRLGERAWMAGWVDLKRLPAEAGVESAVLKLPESMRFEVSGGKGKGMAMELAACMASEAAVTTARVMIEEMVQGLAAGAVAGKAGVALPVVDVTAAGRTITLRVELGEAAVAELLEELRKAMAVPGKD